MAQILPQAKNFGNFLREGLERGISQGTQTGINKYRLSSAFDQLKGMEGSSFQEKLAAIAPTLLTTPGGTQALESLAPLLQAQGNLDAYRKTIDQQRSQGGGLGNILSGAGQESQSAQGPQGTPGQAAQGDQIFRQGQVPSSPNTPFPQRTAGPQPQQEMSPAQLQNYALDLMQNSLATGKPIPFQQAYQDAQKLNEQIRGSNQQILKEKNIQNEAQKQLAQDVVARAQNAGLIDRDSSEDRTVAEKFAMQAQNAPDETTRWEYVRTKLREYDSAKSAIKRELGLANPVGKVYRMSQGSYKEQERLIKDLQRPLQKIKDLGLYDEGLALLTTELGFGNEQAHRAMFPLDKKSEMQLNSFPANSFTNREFSPNARSLAFPGENSALDPKGFGKFKDELAGLLSKNPTMDLVNLRGALNQGKKYAWQDIYKAIDELAEEKRFTPDIEQDKQLNTIRQAPAPGMLDLFQYFWTGKK